MKIVNLEELKTYPNGTVFTTLDEYNNIYGDWHIITGRWEDQPGWNGEIDFIPSKSNKITEDGYVYTQWMVEDSCDYDHAEYKEENGERKEVSKFGVLSQNEIKYLIGLLECTVAKQGFDKAMENLPEATFVRDTCIYNDYDIPEDYQDGILYS